MHSVIFIFTVIVSIQFYILFNRSVLQLCELETCPDCFGNNLCKDIEENKIILEYNSIRDFIFNIFSVKNVYFGLYNNIKVVLKKLAHNSELSELKSNKLVMKVDSNDLINFLVSDSGVKHFKICDMESAKLFLRKLSYKEIDNLQTLIHINIEPILLEIFNSSEGWAVPTLYGYCGRLVIVENTGQPLTQTENFSWFDRAYIAYQLLYAMKNFTENHEHFRLYLTDISPDNIVVSNDLRITFVDLENAILRKKNHGTVHYTEHFDEESYIYSEKQICDGAISDHNIYAVCRLLLSRNAPWPMMENGLLHTPPKVILETYNEVFKNIELCVSSKDKISRFTLADKILDKLSFILKKLYQQGKYLR